MQSLKPIRNKNDNKQTHIDAADLLEPGQLIMIT